MITLKQHEVVERRRLKLYELSWDHEAEEYVINWNNRNKGRIKENRLHVVINESNGWDAGIKDFFPYHMVKKDGIYYFFEIYNWDLFNELLDNYNGDILRAAELMESYEKL
jgi:hypothetical protein